MFSDKTYDALGIGIAGTIVLNILYHVQVQLRGAVRKVIKDCNKQNQDKLRDEAEEKTIKNRRTIVEKFPDLDGFQASIWEYEHAKDVKQWQRIRNWMKSEHLEF